MILKNKKLLILTSLLTLLPIPVGLLLWRRFPEVMAIHWGITGQADGYGSPAFAVFALPVILLASHWLCIFFTTLDKRNRDRNQKIQTVVLWIIPIIGNLSCLGMYALALGWEFSPTIWTLIPMGLLFAVIGNYMPKTRMNSTIGIKVPWTYSSEENWRVTHRFAGRIWVIGGLAMVPAGLLPTGWAVTVMMVDILVLTIVPVVYSWRFYKKELAEGKVAQTGYSKTDKRIGKASLVFFVVLTVFILFVLFYGDITYNFGEDHLLIDANMYTDYVLYFDKVESVEYREGNIPGFRVGGYGSFRLLMGWFENEEFGTYIRYTYYKPESCIVLTARNQTIVLSCETAAETQALYQQLQQRIA